MPNHPPTPLPDDWMIYPDVKRAVRICALAFCAGIILTVLGHLLMPVFLHFPAWAAWAIPAGALAEGTAIISLSLLALWGARVLLASRGSHVTRILSLLTVFPALYAVLILLAPQPFSFKLLEMGRTLDAALLLAAAAAFFSLPYMKGYPDSWRKCFLAWAVLAACYPFQGAAAVLALSLWSRLAGGIPRLLPGMLMALSCVLELALCFFSVLLAGTLARHVAGIASMPERDDPRFPQEEQ